MPTVLSHYAWDGTLLDSFTVPTLSRGIAVDSDGTLWVRDDSNSALLHFTAAGRFLGLVPFPDTWSVWPFDVRPTPLAPVGSVGSVGSSAPGRRDR